MCSTENAFEYETAFDLLVRLNAEGLFLNTCLPSLNSVIRLQPGKCYEIDGDVGTGKTQICYSIAAKFLRSKRTSKIGWISVVPLRTDLLSLHFLKEEQKEHSLDRIVCKRIEKIPELREALDSFSKTANIHLVVVENIDAILHDTAYEKEMGRNVQSDIIDRLRKLTRIGMTVLITNHITHWRGFPAPALGKYWASQISNRFYVEKQDETNVRVIATMHDEQNETVRSMFRIGSNGLESADNA